MDEPSREGDEAEALLRRALIDADESAAVSLRVDGLSLCEALTIVFHARRDLGTIQTYVANGRHGTGAALSSEDLLRVPCDLDLADADDREEAERLYAEQARALRDALAAADTVLNVWREPLEAVTGDRVLLNRSVGLDVSLPAFRILPAALVAPDLGLVVAPVCAARPLAQGRPPMGIACAQPDLVHVYPLADDPERCLEDFFAVAADHARGLAVRMQHQEASVERFLELTGDDAPLV